MTVVNAGTQATPAGPPGKSAYQSAVDNGYSGTITQWLASLVGPPGQSGAAGLSGAAGPAGTYGVGGVSNTLLAAMPTLTVKTNITGSSALPTDSTLTAIIDATIGSTRGSVLYRGASGWSILAPGTSSFVLSSNGSGADPSYKSVAGLGATVPTIQRFLSGSGTYTTPGGVTWIRVIMAGGGAGGVGGGISNVAGTNGGNSTFGTSLLVASGGTSSLTAPTGGAVSTGTGPVNVGSLAGNAGGFGGFNSAATTTSMGGGGGSNGFGYFGAGGGQASGTGNGSAGLANTGAGGGGGSAGAASNATAGNGGGAGGYIDAIIGSPSATYSYAIGAGGTGGTGTGSGLTTGGAGGSGIIIVEEHYGS